METRAWDREELLAAQKRWALVKDRERDESRRTTIDEKLEQVERLMQSIDDFGWRSALDDDARVYEVWNRLRSKLGKQNPESASR